MSYTLQAVKVVHENLDELVELPMEKLSELSWSEVEPKEGTRHFLQNILQFDFHCCRIFEITFFMYVKLIAVKNMHKLVR